MRPTHWANGKRAYASGVATITLPITLPIGQMVMC